MKHNVGTADKIVRIILAIVFAGLYFGNVVTGTFGIVLLVLGIVFLLTAIVGFCPLYTLFGINTCPKK
ncbi:MAG TPA: DUF2892 domain-containing protein [Flavobacteriales bacterium]|nr:DUF2892 domain-containing protein [Flavobacteriales bacterium]